MVAIAVLFLSFAVVPGECAHDVVEGASGPVRWIGADGEFLPFDDDEQVLEFLRTARVVSEKPIEQGVNRSLRLLLETDGVRAHAIFRTVERHLEVERPDRKLHASPRDSYAFECAAYELARMLGIDRVPPAVQRVYRGDRGSIQIWVENAFDEGTRRRLRLRPPDRERWNRQAEGMIVFDALIANRDRNLGNALIDVERGWRVWLVDHTRAFAPSERLRDRGRITRCDRGVWERLRSVDRRRVRDTLEPFLLPEELRGLLARWDRLIAHVQRRIERYGESEVLFP